MSQKNVGVAKNDGTINIHLHGDHNEDRNIDSVINEILNVLVSSPVTDYTNTIRPTSETIEKINYNNLIKTKNIIQTYLSYSEKVEAAFAHIDKAVPFGKSTIITKLRRMYYEALDTFGIEYFGEEQDNYISSLRENADAIIESIRKKVIGLSMATQNKPQYIEQIEIGVDVIIAHAFIECTIMEKP